MTEFILSILEAGSLKQVAQQEGPSPPKSLEKNPSWPLLPWRLLAISTPLTHSGITLSPASVIMWHLKSLLFYKDVSEIGLGPPLIQYGSILT